ncbi:hypothetical protein OSSY52_02020 [Tepiditoga spiralis]|uniref:EamA domain-containing protein n=1 Tax=Tepiditoga spiralis TaxID=2108365 RepID=A0A7G1G1C4_9BACT|nr:EamA family transporter [Tepiditoga spiralis]BBE30061.1 hypothetical protein OSSY52_02020 [Tepiditoga spiralis]
MALIWISIRIILLGYERIAGKKIATNEHALISSWGFFTFSLLVMFPFFKDLNLNIFTISLISGSIYTISFFLYVYALSIEDASIIAPLYNMNVVFLILTTFLFLSESITLSKILGSLLMIYGVSFLKKDINIIESYKNLFKSKGAIAMIVSSFLMAIGRTLDGFFAKNMNTTGYSVGIYTVVSLELFVFSLIKFKSLKPHINLIKNKYKDLISGGISNSYSYIALLNAFKYIDVSIAEPVSMLSTLVTAIIAKVVFKEKISVRLAGILILILGAFVIYK